MRDILMTIPIVKTATESEDEARVIDALKLAFVAILLRVGYGQIRRNIFHISLALPRLLEEKHLHVKPLITLETILVQLFGFRQTFIPM
jgi:hypothetical protein